jgi:hypothetical protein
MIIMDHIRSFTHFRLDQIHWKRPVVQWWIYAILRPFIKSAKTLSYAKQRRLVPRARDEARVRV